MPSVGNNYPLSIATSAGSSPPYVQTPLPCVNNSFGVKLIDFRLKKPMLRFLEIYAGNCRGSVTRPGRK